MFVDPSSPNLADFYAYCLSSGVPAADLPSGTLTTVTIDTSGNISAASTSGTVSAGEVLSGTNIPDGTYLTAWSATSGTVSPPPPVAVSTASASAYSVYAVWALNYALQVAISGSGIGGLPGFAGQYVMAVYNLGVHQLLVIAQDLPNQDFFTQARITYNLNSLVPGPVLASGDQATSETLLVPDFFKNLTLSELDLIKTPFGRRYLSYSQMYGSTIVGVS